MKRVNTQHSPTVFQSGKIGLGWLLFIAITGLIIIVFVLPDGEPQTHESLPTPQFDDRLLLCNDVVDAEPTDAFTQCLEAAKDGHSSAQSKMAWAYSQSGDYQNLEEAYRWVSHVAYFDRSAELIRYILLRLFGDNPADIAYGEAGIQRLANLNYAPAAAYLGILYKLGENVLDETSNSMWLLQRAHQKDPEVFNAFQLAIIYANGFGVKQDYSKARDVLLTYAEHEFPMTTNNVAWFLATLEENPLSSPDTAVTLAQSVTSVEPHGNNHVYVDTLAATYAANGDYALAIEYQNAALDKLQEQAKRQTNNDYSTLISEYNERLALYKDDQKAVTESLKREYDSFFRGVKVFVERRLISGLNVRIERPNTESL